jgi:hypothetical protein
MRGIAVITYHMGHVLRLYCIHGHHRVATVQYHGYMNSVGARPPLIN